METKVCRWCSETKTINQFWVANLYANRITAKCAQCRDETRANRGVIHSRPNHLDESYIYCYPGKHWVQKDTEIWRNRAQKRGYASSCKACDTVGVRERGRKYDETLRDWLSSTKDKPCMDCHKSWPSFVLDWHHRIGTEKLFAVSQHYKFTKAQEVIAAEIAKCDLVCANCHRLRHFEEGSMGQNQYS